MDAILCSRWPPLLHRLKFQSLRSDRFNMSSIFRRLSVTAFLGAAEFSSRRPPPPRSESAPAWRGSRTTPILEDVDSVRFTGGDPDGTHSAARRRAGHRPQEGVVRLLNEEVALTRSRLSLLMRLAGGNFRRFLLGGPGWSRRSVEVIDGSDLNVSTQGVRLARRHRARDQAGPAHRHPRRLSLHLPRLQRRR